MSSTLTARIIRKTEQAMGELAAIRSGAATMAADAGTSAEDWARFANKVAEAEGAASVWARINNMVAHSVNQGVEVTEAMLAEVVADMLINGADDSWSGRTNDVKRARFDGVRSAASNVRYL